MVGWSFILFLLGQGAVVAAVTQAFKAHPWVAKHPKLVAAILNLLAVIVQVYAVGTIPEDIRTIIMAYISSFLSAIGTYEVGKAVARS